MGIGPIVFKELVKNGYSLRFGTRVWDIAKRDLLYMTPELSKGFLNLRNHERYKVNLIDREVDLLRVNSDKILVAIGDEAFNLIDVGCGDGLKANAFIESTCDKCKIRFCPVSNSRELVDLALKNVRDKKYPGVTGYKESVANFDALDEVISFVRNSDYQRNVILLLGSLIASFDINYYLRKASEAMLPGDVLLIGNGIRTGERFANLETYRASIFNEWFMHLMRELGFTDDEVEYDSRFANGRLEGFYRVKVDKKISYDGREREIRKGDEILAAYQYKYYSHELLDFCRMYFKDAELVCDPDNEHALVICKK